MPRRAASAVAAAATMALWSCTGLLLPGDPADDPRSSFEVLWREFDRHYAFFVQKGIDWDALGDEHRALLGPAMSDPELHAVMASMLERLQDGHVSLRSTAGTYRYTAWLDRAPRNFDAAVARAYPGTTVRAAPSGHFLYGRIGPETGYLWVADFGGAAWAAEVDDALDALRGVTRIVLDVRGNGGGSDGNARQVAGRFVDARRVYRLLRYRDGPGHSDFSDPEEDRVEPTGRVRFQGPVALLTNREVFSAAEAFVLAMRTSAAVTVVGDTTGGGYGNPIGRELPNGWTFRVPRWIQLLPDGTQLRDGVGLAPDVTVWNADDDATNGIDSIIDTALGLLGTAGPPHER